jgi:hypothetical protein
MILTKATLKRLIKEELNALMREALSPEQEKRNQEYTKEYSRRYKMTQTERDNEDLEKNISKIISEIRPLIAAAIQGERVPDIKWTPSYVSRTSREFGGNISIMLDSWLEERGYMSEYGKDDFFYEVEVAIENALSHEFPEVKNWLFSSVEED